MFISVNKPGLRLGLVFTICAAVIVIALTSITPGSKAKVNRQTNLQKKKSQRPAYVPGEVLVRYRSESLAQDKTNRNAVMTADNGAAIQIAVESFRVSEMIPGARLARVAPEQTLEAVDALRRQPDVLYAEPNYILHAATTNPNDTRFVSHQWNLVKIGAPQAYDTIRGSKNSAEAFFGNPQIVIGVIDQGIDISHQDLAANIWVNPGETVNGADDDGNGRIDDINGFNFFSNNGTIFSGQNSEIHASHVAGIAGAVGNNSKGISGVNWSVGLMSLKFLDHFGSGSTAKAIEAVQYAKQMRDMWIANNNRGANIRVLNASFGGGGFSQMFEDAINQANTSGILFVAAAGNIDIGTSITNNDLVPHYPASFNAPNIISVASTTQADGLSTSFTHFGPTSVDLGAPGESILSTTPECTVIDPDICDPVPEFTEANGDSYSLFSGTSMSAPHVSGSAALLWAKTPTLTVAQVKSMLLLSGDVLAPLVDKTLTGRRLNLNNSLQSVMETADSIAPGAVAGFQVNSQSGRTFTLGWTASGDDGATGTAALYQLSFTDSAPGSTPIPLKGVVPANSGVAQTTNVIVPYRHTAGTLTLQEFDNRGNEGTPQTVSITIPASIGDPYLAPTVGPAAPLTTDTSERQNLNDDDVYADYLFPTGFTFPFFGTPQQEVKISSNGALYFGDAPVRPNGDADDVPSSPRALGGFFMIAGLWDDLNLQTAGAAGRPDAGVYIVRNTPTNPTRLTFRWQAKPCNFNGTVCTGGDPVNFEIELRNDGTIKVRYGSGNTSLFPTVGIAGGSPDAYVVTSHTSEETPINLTNAGEVTFTPRTLTAAATVHFSQAASSVNEAGTSVNVTVTRTGDTSGVTTVDYFTSDTDNFTVNCSQPSGGNAFARCDFATSVDTLTFAASETSKTFAIPIINDAIAEGNETFIVVLSNVTGGTLGTPLTTTITINDNDAVTGANPIFTTPFFVRQHYLDFLSREPEVGEPWSNVLNTCSDVNNNPACDRLTVSGAFFGSPEFQLKGYFTYRFYKLAFNRLPLYTEIVVDMRAVTGSTPAETFAKKAAFTNNFVARTEFTNLYIAMSNTQYVNTLMGRYSLTSITTPDPGDPDGTSKVTLTTTDLINQLNAAILTRAQVLRAIADSDQVFNLEFNQGFVAMQYFGYLRRNPDTAGYNAWLDYLNTHPGDSRTMVNGFMNSTEYRLRFGPPTP